MSFEWHTVCNWPFFCLCSKIQKYSPTESAKVYDKAVNRKNNIHFYPRQTLDFIANNMAHASLTNDVKRHIVRQYLDVSYKHASNVTLPVVAFFIDLLIMIFKYISERIVRLFRNDLVNLVLHFFTLSYCFN